MCECDCLPGGFTKVAALRQLNPRLKVMISVGGWNAGSTAFSDMVSTRLKRKLFIESALRFMRRYNFDGLDTNWEFPGVRGGRENDRENFDFLVQVRQFIDREMSWVLLSWYTLHNRNWEWLLRRNLHFPESPSYLSVRLSLQVIRRLIWPITRRHSGSMYLGRLIASHCKKRHIKMMKDYQVNFYWWQPNLLMFQGSHCKPIQSEGFMFSSFSATALLFLWSI